MIKSIVFVDPIDFQSRRIRTSAIASFTQGFVKHPRHMKPDKVVVMLNDSKSMGPRSWNKLVFAFNRELGMIGCSRKLWTPSILWDQFDIFQQKTE